ncbi:alginate export family protein [Parahaliea mediterranea]|uniref:alginate export family protein n=1 Tax=Parahaliea mediterranea TaxID=651086 RepID=UPI000E2F0CED|nr:alginate export family protein [Parahaliea mediterranea]
MGKQGRFGVWRSGVLLGMVALLAAGARAEGGADSYVDSHVDSGAASIDEMLTKGDVELDLRYRFEHVDQDGFDHNADASTLRTRIGFTTAAWKGLSLMAEVDNVTAIGAEDYNSTENGETQFPVVADPEGTDINQVWARYSAGDASGTYGRQRILHGNERFIGGVAWRQNEQTYDGFRLQWQAQAQAVELDYAYVYNVNRIFGPDDGAQPADWHGKNHFLRLKASPWDGHTVAAFGYLLDIDPQSAYGDNLTRNNGADTWGIEYSGKLGPVAARAAYARQSDAGDSQRDYSADYYLLEGGMALGPVNALVGYEVLGAGDGVGFATPLATLHKFQGFADLFLTTPGDGIEDLYLTLSGALGPVKLAGTWHDFKAEDSSADFGSELDLVATWPINTALSLQLKYANFSSDASARYADTEKAWLMVNFNI